MIDSYRFDIYTSSISGKEYKINEHKVSSGVYTMLFLKVLDNDKYRKEYVSTNKFETGDGYYNIFVTTVFNTREIEEE